jgi:regulatory protein
VPVVTLLQIDARRKDRVEVHLDGTFAFSLALDLAASLHKGQCLAEDDLARLCDDDAYRVALDRALGFLARRPRSEAEVRRHLADKDVPPAPLERVCARLVSLDLLDDAAFARWWVDNRRTHQPRGRLALRHELTARGVAPGVVATVVAEVDETSEATALARSRASRYAGLDRPAFDRRLGALLARRGFGAAAVRAALAAARRLGEPDGDVLGDDDATDPHS